MQTKDQYGLVGWITWCCFSNPREYKYCLIKVMVHARIHMQGSCNLKAYCVSLCWLCEFLTCTRYAFLSG